MTEGGIGEPVLTPRSHSSPFDLILVHGAGGNSLVWNRTINRLEGKATALAVDLPGHPSGPITCHSVSEYTEALLGSIKDFGLNRPVVCGHSMGGAVVLNLAIEHPDAIGGLILVSTGAKLGVDTNIVSGLRENPMRTIEAIITPRSFYSIDLGLGREARTALSFSNLPVFLNDYLACDGFDARKSLDRVRSDTLIICGDRDQLTPPKWAHYLHSNIPRSELRFVRDSGHMLPLEKPGALASVIQSFGS